MRNAIMEIPPTEPITAPIIVPTDVSEDEPLVGVAVSVAMIVVVGMGAVLPPLVVVGKLVLPEEELSLAAVNKI